MKSLRFRITAVATGVLTIVLALAAVLIAMLVARQLQNELAEQNQATMTRIADELAAGFPPRSIDLPLATDGTEFLILDDQGRVVHSTIVVTNDVIPPAPTNSADPNGLGGSHGFTDSEGFVDVGFDYTLIEESTMAATAPTGVSYEVVSLAPTIIVDRSVAQVRSVLWLIIPILAAVFAALVWVLTGRVLAPVAEMTTRVNSIRGDTLHERLVERGTNDEIDRLANTLNSMLDRLDVAARQQREFVSDASHELRSPLTLIVGTAELAADPSNPVDRDQALAAHQKILDHGQKMARLIDDLLALAQSGEAALRFRDVDLDEVIREQARALSRPIDTAAVEPIRMIGDEGALGRLIRNLLDNADRYAAERIAVAASKHGDRIVVTVDDDGPGIPPDQRQRVFERFGRADASRARTTGGTGLGLAISSAIVEAHGGTIAVEDGTLGGARLTVTLPTSAGITA